MVLKTHRPSTVTGRAARWGSQRSGGAAMRGTRRPRSAGSPAGVVRVLAADGDSTGPGAWLKKAKNNIPIIGLFERFTSVDGIDRGADQTYPEFSRGLYERAPMDMGPACADLRSLFPNQVSEKAINYCLWLANSGVTLLTDDELVICARRGVMNKDFEYEAYRFEQERDEAKAMLAKGRFVLHETVGSRALAIRVMEDALCGGYANEVSAEAKELVAIIAAGAFPDSEASPAAAE